MSTRQRCCCDPVVETANPPLKFLFPMREFGEKNKVKWASTPNGFQSGIGCTMTAAMTKCICIKTVTTKRLNSTAGNIKDSAFIHAGFCNWKDATVSFPNHETSDTQDSC